MNKNQKVIMKEGQFRAITGSEISKAIIEFLEEKYRVKVELMDVSFLIVGTNKSILRFALNSCKKREKPIILA